MPLHFPALGVETIIDSKQITDFGTVTLRGDLRSYAWDGGSDLTSGADSGATAGFLLDSSAGAGQFQQIYARGIIIAASGSDIDWSYITNVAIENADITSLAFDKITAATNTASLVIGGAGLIKSSNYVAGSAGFQIEGDGDAEFNDVTVRGAVIAGTGSTLPATHITAGTITAQQIILSDSASSILKSGNYSAGTAGWQILGNGDAEFNDVTVRGTIFATTGELGDLDITGTLDIGSGGEITIASTASANTIVRLGYLTGVAQYGGLEVWGDITSDDEPSAIYSTLTEQMNVQVGIADSSTYAGGQVTLHSGNGVGSEPAINLGFYGVADGVWASFGTELSTGDYLFRLFSQGGTRQYIWRVDDSDFDSLKFFVRNSSGTENHLYSMVDTAQMRFVPGSASVPPVAIRDTNTGFYSTATGAVAVTAGGEPRMAWSLDAGAGTGVYIHQDLSDVGNVEVLRAPRTAGGANLVLMGYFSSWERDPDSGELRKDDILSLADSPRWDREWFQAIRPIDFRRVSTGEREFGFLLDEWKATADDMKYLTTNGDKWGGQPHETAVLAATVLEVQDLERRVRALEAAA